jgi:hypothetical protein
LTVGLGGEIQTVSDGSDKKRRLSSGAAFLYPLLFNQKSLLSVESIDGFPKDTYNFKKQTDVSFLI